MDRNKFYKQIMSEYTFDKEKIRMSAKRPAPLRHKISFTRTFVPLASAAAILLVAVGTISMMSKVQPPPIEIVPNNSALSAQVRLEEAEKNYYTIKSKTSEAADMYVSFEKEMSYKEIEMLISSVCDTGEIKTEKYYKSDGNVAEQTPEKENAVAIAVKITAPSAMYNELQDLPAVTLVELKSDKINDETFKPITPEEVSEANTAITTPAQTSPPETTISPENSDSSVVDSETSETSETVLEPEDEDESLETDTTIELDTIDLPITGVSFAKFINDNCFVATRKDGFGLYRINDGDKKTLETISQYSAEGTRVAWSNKNENKMLISGLDENKKRTKLWLVDGVSSAVYEVNVSEITQNAELTNVFYNDVTSKAIIKTVSANSNYIYSATISETGFTATLEVSSAEPITTLALNGLNLYYSSSINNKNVINVYNIETKETKEIKSYPTNVKYIRSPMFDSFAVISELSPIFNEETGILSAAEKRVEIFSPLNGSFVEVQAAESITFSRLAGEVFSDGTSVYKVTPTGCETITDSGETTKHFVTPPNSLRYTVLEVGEEILKIKIV